MGIKGGLVSERPAAEASVSLHIHQFAQTSIHTALMPSFAESLTDSEKHDSRNCHHAASQRRRKDLTPFHFPLRLPVAQIYHHRARWGNVD